MSDAWRPDEDEPSLLAAEYALGVLEREAHESAARREATDPAFAEEVAAWRERLAPLAEDVAPVDPPPELFASIAARIDAEARPAPESESATRRVTPLHRGVRWRSWQAAAAGLALAASLVIAAVVFWPDETGPDLVASLRGDQNHLVDVAWLEEARLVQARITQGELPAGSVAELWVVPDGGAPVSLGVIENPAGTELSVPQDTEELLRPGATLAVSVEPPGGSPTGAPTGPVIASAQLRES